MHPTMTGTGRGTVMLAVFCVLTLLVPFALLVSAACTCSLGLECVCPHHGGRHAAGPPSRPHGDAAAQDCHQGAGAPAAGDSCRLRPAPRSEGSDPGRLAALFDLSTWLSLSGLRSPSPLLADIGAATAAGRTWRDRDPSRPVTPPPRPFVFV